MKRRLRILILFERSGAVREAFRALGHDAISCDLAPAEDGSPHHLQCDAFWALVHEGPWDLVIAHPPCTRLANSGVLRLYKDGKKAKGIDRAKWNEMRNGALMFRRVFTDYDGPLCVENPVMHGHALAIIGLGCSTEKQSIQPYEFGHDASKRTVLWLRGLPPLPKDPAKRVKGRMVHTDQGGMLERFENQTDSGQNRLGPSDTRAIDRARTYSGIAEAMAATWVKHLLSP